MNNDIIKTEPVKTQESTVKNPILDYSIIQGKFNIGFSTNLRPFNNENQIDIFS